MDYKIIKCIKGGEDSQTYIVQRIDNGMYLVLKELSANVENREYYSMEGMILGKRIHKGIPNLYSLEEKEGKFRILEEYIAGESLRSLLKKAQTLETVLFCVREICKILQSIHESGYVYLDLKPEHIICGEKGVYLVDFGNCRRIGTKVGEKLTEHYCAPEQLYDAVVHESMDIYSIGVLLMEIRQYFTKQNKKNQWMEWLSEVIEGCMMREPHQRYQSMKELIAVWDGTEFSESKVHIYGFRRYIGCTHLAFSLGKYLSKKGQKVVYINLGDENIYNTLLENGALQKRSGVWDDTGIKEDIACLYLYQDVLVWKDDWYCFNGSMLKNIWICDHGEIENWEEELHSLKDTELGIVVISGTAMWHNRRQFLDDVHNIRRQGKNVIFVGNFVDKKDFKELKKQLDGTILYMPYFSLENVDEGNMEVKRFMKQLDRVVTQRLKVGLEMREKIEMEKE